MLLEIIAPNRKIFSGEVQSVTLPGMMGYFQILENHAPLISTLGEGTIKVKDAEGLTIFNLKSGVVEVMKNKVIVLADSI